MNFFKRIKLHLGYAITVIIILFSSVPNAHASHISGAAVSYKHIGNNLYQVKAYLTLDCGGVKMGNSLIMSAVCSSNGISKVFPVNLAPFVAPKNQNYMLYSLVDRSNSSSSTMNIYEITDACNRVLNPRSAPSSNCRTNTQSIQGFAMAIFTGIVQLNPCNSWKISLQPPCCRNNSNANIFSSGTYVETRINTLNFPTNNPTKININGGLKFSACLGQLGGFTIPEGNGDNDSLTYKLVCARTDSLTCVSYDTSKNYSALNPIAGIQIDSLTGKVSYRPLLAGDKVIAILINEYERCSGKWKGSSLVDVQVEVNVCSNSFPVNVNGISSFSGPGSSKIDSFRLKVNPNSYFTIEDTVMDADMSDSIYVVADYFDEFPNGSLQVTYIQANTAFFVFRGRSNHVGGKQNVRLVLSDNRCNLSMKSYLNYEVFSRKTLGIYGNGIALNDTVKVMTDDSIALSTNGIGMHLWNSLGGATFSWSGSSMNVAGDTTINDTNKTITYWPKASGYLTVSSRVSDQCSRSSLILDSVYVQVIQSFQLTMANDTAVCWSNDSLELRAQADTNLNFIYTWKDASNKIIGNNSSVKVSPYLSAKYSVLVQASNGGIRNQSINVRINPRPNVTLRNRFNSTYCKGSILEIEPVIDSNTYRNCGLASNRMHPETIGTHDSLNLLSADTGIRSYPNVFSAKHHSSGHKFLYRASDLRMRGMLKGVIQGVSFYVDSTSLIALYDSINSFSIGFDCVSDSSFGNGAIFTSFTNALIGKKLSLTHGWNYVEFSKPYNWNGTDNLVMSICSDRITKGQSSIKIAMQKTNYHSSITRYNNYYGSNCTFHSTNTISDTTSLPVVKFSIFMKADTNRFEYKWFPSTSFLNHSSSTGYFKPDSSMLYTLVVMDTLTKCTDTTSRYISVSDFKVDLGGDIVQCEGTDKHITATVIPFKVGSGSFKWGPSSGNIKSTQNENATIQFNGNGKVWVNYTNVRGCNLSDTINVTTNKNADPTILSTGPFCEMDSINPIHVATPGGVFFPSAHNDFNFDATYYQQPGETEAKRVGIRYQVKSAQGCWGDTTIYVYVTRKFNTDFQLDSTYCSSDDPIRLKTKHDGGTWSGPGVSNAIFDPEIAGIGDHSIRVDSIGSCGDSGAFNLTVIQGPLRELEDTSWICDKAPKVLDAGNSGSIYLWSTGETTSRISVLQEAIYWVEIQNNAGCIANDTTFVKFGGACVGVEEQYIRRPMFEIYPNPANSKLEIYGSEIQLNPVIVVISDIHGKRLKEFSLDAKNKVLNNQIDISNFNPGVYLFTISSGDNFSTYRVIVE